MALLKGFVRDIRYSPQLPSKLPEQYPLSSFDVNASKHYGLINLGIPENNLAFARWISPKRTRSYPFARLYDIFHFNTRKVAIVPIIKDEGAASNNDRINFMTFSWMSLLDVFIVLAWYEDAVRKPGAKELITGQKLNAVHVRDKLAEISTYHLSALHWNTSHFEREFQSIYMNAVQSYERISDTHKVILHSVVDHLNVLRRYSPDGKFSLEAFKLESLTRSLSAAQRETVTSHKNEALSDGAKNLLYVSNYLGGEYHLSPDEVYYRGDTIVIQESKNSTKIGRSLSLDDVKDGLFKLILYSNLDQLYVDGVRMLFEVRLKITGGFAGELRLPQEDESYVRKFCAHNHMTVRQMAIVEGLQRETLANPRLNIILVGRG